MIRQHGELRIGDRVSVPGHRRTDPRSTGVLVRIDRIDYQRSGPGYFAVVRVGDRIVTTAIGLVRKED